jgi:hypothetical protein
LDLQRVDASSVISSINRLSGYVNSTYNASRNGDSELEEAFINMFTFMQMRISALEEWRARESGEMDIPQETVDDPNYLGKTALQVSNVSMHSMRMTNLEGEVSNLKQIQAADFATLQGNLHQQAYNLSLVVNLTKTMIEDISNVRKRLTNMETYLAGGIKDKLQASVIEDVSGMFKSAGQVAKGLVEWVPGVEGVIDAGSDLMEGVIGLFYNSYKLASKRKAFEYIMSGTSNAKLIAFMIQDSYSIKPEVINTNMLSTNIILNSMEIANILSAATFEDDDAVKKLPMLGYWLRPMNSNEAVTAIGEAAINVINRHPGVKLAQFSNRIPVHGYITINYEIDSVTRRQFVMSVGLEEISVKAVFLNGTKSFAEYIDRIQTYNASTDKWQTVRNNYATPGANTSNFEEDISHCTLIETYPVRYSYNYIREFFDCLHKHETPYDLFFHNCQTMSREVINFVVAGSTPHWWDPSCSVKTLLAEFSDLHRLQAPYVMPKTLSISGNHLPNIGTAPANQLTAYRDAHATNLAQWIAKLS